MIEFNEIGIVKTEINEKKDSNWGEAVSKIVLNEELRDGLTGLSEFSHVLVIFFLHEAKFNREQHIKRRPQGREDMPEVGIWAQRVKDRPNPIGVTSVELVEVTDDGIIVRGLDAIDGTLVIDIKPYFPMYDCKNEAKVPEWVYRLMENYF